MKQFRESRFRPFCVNPGKGNYVVFDRKENKSHGEPGRKVHAIELATELNNKYKSWNSVV